MGDSKPHPSEFLEFSTISPDLTNTRDSLAQSEKPTPKNGSSSLPPYDDSPYQHMPRRGSVVQTAAQTEHRMTFTQALRLYPKAIGWSFMISLAIIMEGFDTALISSFYGGLSGFHKT